MRVAGAFAVVAVLASTAVLADDDALAERVRELEATVAALSARVKALEATPTALRADPAPQTRPWTLPVGNSPVLGPKKARYTLVVFGDLQCPFCSRLDPTVRELVDDPELKGKINVVYKHFPLSFHKDARPAARLAVAVQKVAGDKAAWDFIGLAYANQRDLSEEALLAIVDELQLARAPVLKAAATADSVIDADVALGNASNIRGTPSVFVNGWELKQRSVDGVKTLIKERKL